MSDAGYIQILSSQTLEKFFVGDIFSAEFEKVDDSVVSVQLTPSDEGKPIRVSFDDGKKARISITLSKSGFINYKVSVVLKDGSNQTILDENKEPILIRIQVDPAWLTEAIFYCVFVRFFQGQTTEVDKSEMRTVQPTGISSEELSKKHATSKANPGGGGTFDDVKSHLDELRKMGVTALYFNPIHIIGDLYRGYNIHDQLPGYLQPGSPYSIKDFKSIDPELTYDRDTKKHLLSDPQQEFKDLVEACHQRGMYVVMDMVFNHTAHDFVLQRIRPEWYLYKKDITSLDEPYLYPEDIEKGLPWGDPKHTMAPFDHGIWWEDAAQLNWEHMLPEAPNKPPANTSIDEMWEYFASIPKYWIQHFGVDGFRCDIAYRVPSAFWRRTIEEARSFAQKTRANLSHDVVFIAEAYTNNLRELQEVGFSAVYGDFSNKLSKPIQLKGYLEYMHNISGNHFPKGSSWFIFPESHDFGRTPQKILGEKAGDAGLSFLANTSRWLLTATLDGIPLIFNGFEKIEWQSLNLFSYGAVNWERDKDLREFISKVNLIRHQHLSLQRGNYVYLETNQGLDENTQLFSFMRTYEKETLIVAVNMDVEHSAGPAEIFLPESFEGNYSLTDLLTGEVYERKGRNLTVVLSPGSGHIFLVN